MFPANYGDHRVQHDGRDAMSASRRPAASRWICNGVRGGLDPIRSAMLPTSVFIPVATTTIHLGPLLISAVGWWSADPRSRPDHRLLRHPGSSAIYADA